MPKFDEGGMDMDFCGRTSLTNPAGPQVFNKFQRKGIARRSCNPSSADFQVCCVAGFQTRRLHDCGRSADLEVGDTAGLETCATKAGGRYFEKSSQNVTILGKKRVVLSADVIVSCEDFPGVRPSPGAATSLARSALDYSPTFLPPHVAAAGDGCTPFRLRLRRAAFSASRR